MDVSKCPECKKALRAALVKGLDPSKLKMKDGHLPGCPTLNPPAEEKADAVYPWSEQVYRITPPQVPGPRQGSQDGGGRLGDSPASDDPAGSADRSPRNAPANAVQRPQRRDRRAEHRGRERVPDSGYQQATRAAEQSRIQKFKVVDHASAGERRDHLKGVWFPFLVLGLIISGIFAPPLALLFLGAIAMLFLIR